VTFTACDAQQIGLSPAYDFSLLGKELALFQNKRTEQKAPQALGPIRIVNEVFSIRGLTPSPSRPVNPSGRFQYKLAAFDPWAHSLCLRLNSCESTRAPPRMDPPISC
jgi:hypothetical protein